MSALLKVTKEKYKRGADIIWGKGSNMCDPRVILIKIFHKNLARDRLVHVRRLNLASLLTKVLYERQKL